MFINNLAIVVCKGSGVYLQEILKPQLKIRLYGSGNKNVSMRNILLSFRAALVVKAGYFLQDRLLWRKEHLLIS